MTVTNYTPEEHLWASKTAMALRVHQADFADISDEQRRSLLDDVVKKALHTIPPDKRTRYLRALAEHFPTGTITVSKPVEAEPADNSPEALVDTLVRIASSLPKALVTEFGVRLQEAGYIGSQSTTLEDLPSDELSQSLPIDPMKQFDRQRVYRLLAAFADYYLGLENIIWKTWQTLSSTTTVRRETGSKNDVRKVSAQYIQGDTEVNAEQLRKLIEQTRKVMGGLLGAIPAGSAAFLERFNAEFDPDEIMRMAKADRSLPGWTDEAKAWNKFKKMMADQKGQIFEEKMYDAIARKAEELMGISRKEKPNQ